MHPRLSNPGTVLSEAMPGILALKAATVLGRRGSDERGKVYVGLLDVVGEEEGTGPEVFDSGARRDSTALTIVELATPGQDLSACLGTRSTSTRTARSIRV